MTSETEDAGVYKCTAEVAGETLERQIVLELYGKAYLVSVRLFSVAASDYSRAVCCFALTMSM